MYMNQFVTDSKITQGHLELDNIPFPDNSEVRIFIVPKPDLSNMSFKKIQQMTKTIQGNLSEDIDKERGDR